MAESVEQAARRVLQVARESGDLPLPLALALLALRNALGASGE